MKLLKDKFGGAVAGKYDEICFARQLAKIAHSYVYAEHRAIETYEMLLPGFILTGVGDYRALIGCGTEPLDTDQRKWLCNIHWGRVVIDDYAYLVSRFRIFAFSRTFLNEHCRVLVRKRCGRSAFFSLWFNGPISPAPSAQDIESKRKSRNYLTHQPSSPRELWPGKRDNSNAELSSP